MRPLRANEFEIDGGAIVIQACDETYAHVGIWLRDRMTYHHIAIPSLEREWRKIYYNDEVKPAEFDAILQANKSRLLETVEKLNAAEQGVHLTGGILCRQQALSIPEQLPLAWAHTTPTASR